MNHTLVISWVSASICFSSFMESSNVGFRRCLFCKELSSFIRDWILDKTYWDSSKLSVQSGGIRICVDRPLLFMSPPSWWTREAVSDRACKYTITVKEKYEFRNVWVTIRFYLLRVKITALDCIIPHKDENLCQGSCCHFQALAQNKIITLNLLNLNENRTGMMQFYMICSISK